MESLPPCTSFHDQPAVESFLAGRRGGKATYPVLRRALYREGLSWEQALLLVPEPTAQALAERFCWTTSHLESCFDAADGSTKALWKARDGHRYESVLVRHRLGRTTLCVSCQIGCALGCEFCSTGRMGAIRDLDVAEILEQATWAVQTLRSEGKTLRNVVFMGMGEPLLAMDSVRPALEGLLDQKRFEITPRFLSLSTCGVPAAIEPFFTEFPQVKLAVSLHAPRQDLRDSLMPGCRRWPLTELMPALDRYTAQTGHKLFFEYIMIAGVNDGPRESRELAELLRHRWAHVNLIPYNPSGTTAWAPSDRPTLDAFQRALGEAGIPSTVRHSAGDAIAAACGQLAGNEPSGNRRGKAPSTVEANTN